MKNKVFIATSLDGFIADNDGGIEWLDIIPEINKIDSGYSTFVSTIDAIVMGRKSFEKVLSFDIEWPYKLPVFVVSNSLKFIPPKFDGKVILVSGEIDEILEEIHELGYLNLYIDGGKLIQSFLKKDLIDEMTITIIPILLGNGIPLFNELDKSLLFECKETKLFLESIVQNRYVRKNKNSD